MLDSGQPNGEYGRYDIISARPFITIVTQHGATTVCRENVQTTYDDNPFDILKSILSEYPYQKSDWPFAGGAIGYFSYDLGRYLEKMPVTAHDGEQIPDMCIGIYDWALVVDHLEKKTVMLSSGLNPASDDDWQKLYEVFIDTEAVSEARGHFRVTSSVLSNLDESAYSERFEKVKRYIEDGDCYQVNLAQRFSAHAEGDGWIAYRRLREISPAPFMAYLRYPWCEVLSASPERFLQLTGRHIETRPIKGTRPRSSDASVDRRNADELVSSQKDRAENLMIVDLLRNDISKSSQVGSVRAESLFALESFSNVHHLVSTVAGVLAEDKTAIDLLRGCFPGGSITGAPKLRSMEIIEEMEPHRRGVYCGAIGYIGFDGNMDTNIAIRTAVYSRNEIRFWAGGGIVADSEMHKEYRETWDKASTMLELTRCFSRINED